MDFLQHKKLRCSFWFYKIKPIGKCINGTNCGRKKTLGPIEVFFLKSFFARLGLTVQTHWVTSSQAQVINKRCAVSKSDAHSFFVFTYKDGMHRKDEL